MNEGAEAANASGPQCLALIKVKVNMLNSIYLHQHALWLQSFLSSVNLLTVFYNSLITLSVYKMPEVKDYSFVEQTFHIQNIPFIIT